MLVYILFGIFILACLVLVVAVLLQPGKADAGALFTSSVSSTAFGPRGTQSILARITIGAAASFMLVALILSLPVINGSHSVLQSETIPSSSPRSSPTPTPAASPAKVPLASPAASAAGNTNANSGAKSATPAASPAAKKLPEPKNR